MPVEQEKKKDMILGVGTDIVLMARIRKLSPAAVTRLLTAREKKYCAKYGDASVHVAGRFAAKEAVLKAMGKGLSEGISWHHLEILPDPAGAPRVKFSGAALAHFKKLNATRCHLSISHQGEYAVAFAVLESRLKSG